MALLPATACLETDDDGGKTTDQALDEGDGEGTGSEGIGDEEGEPVCDAEDDTMNRTCIDCACDCGDGNYQPYGGCFGACDEIPFEIDTCSADCTSICGAS